MKAFDPNLLFQVAAQQPKTPVPSPGVRPPLAGRVEVTSENTEVARVLKEVEVQVIMAKRFPRDVEAAREKMLAAARRPRFAQVAMYEYKQGAGNITKGLSIRCAEMMVQNWGNAVFGIREVAQVEGASQMLAFAWDMEANVYQSRDFIVKHVRDKQGDKLALTSERDIYENNANLTARRMRAAILGIIPKDIQDDVEAEVERTLTSDPVPLSDRLNQMLAAFAPLGVRREHIEGFLRMRLSAVTELQFVRLRRVYQSLVDKIASPEEFFGPIAPAPGAVNPNAVFESFFPGPGGATR
jgi:hypothetical protein